jgi:ADP-heptose:LPS heptosyltransferase
MAAKSRLKLGFDKKRCKEYTWLFPFTRIPPDDPNKHMLNQYLDFCRFLEIPDEERVHWEIPNSPDTTADLPTPYVVLNIGATKKANRWSPEKFAALADMLWNKKRIFCVLTGGQGDANQSMIITEKAMSRVINLVGKTSIQDLTGILDHAMAVVSCDTGPMHLSVALGTPTIALFGPSNPRRTGPYKGEVILAHYHCSPCNHKKCPDPRCMAMIDPEEVYKKTVVHTSASPSPVHPVN